MSCPQLAAGTLVIARQGLGVIIRVGTSPGGAPGYYVSDHTGDPGASMSYPTFSPDWCTRPAVVGQTVCEHPWPHSCGLHHVTRDDLLTLGVAPEDIPAYMPSPIPSHRKPIERVRTVGGFL